MPYHQSVLHKVKPIYETLPGWGTEIDTVERFDDLPQQARDFVEFVQSLARVPITFLGLGPGREKTVVLPAAA